VKAMMSIRLAVSSHTAATFVRTRVFAFVVSICGIHRNDVLYTNNGGRRAASVQINEGLKNSTVPSRLCLNPSLQVTSPVRARARG
jgi:hypothetical protein